MTAQSRTPELRLRVAEALLDDARKGLVRVSQARFAALALEPGGIVAVTGGRTTHARLVPGLPGQCGEGEAMMDGVTRENAGAALGAEVTLRPAKAREATSVVLTPLDPTVPFADTEESEFVKRCLIGFPLTPGDKVAVHLFGAREAALRVSGAAPAGGPVVVTSHTVLRLLAPDVFEDSFPKATYEDVGGLAAQVRLVREIVELPLRYPDVFARLGIEPPKGILLYGPPGTGKTLIARAVAGESGLSFLHVNGPEVMHKFYGESEARLREVFEEARRKAPSILFLDELDALAPRRAEAIGDVEKRVVGQLLALMDGLVSRGQVVVIAATNMPDLLDPALRRPGRFDREVFIPVPDLAGRLDIFRIHTRGMALDPGVDLKALASLTHGYVGADIAFLCREAGMGALRRLIPTLAGIPAEKRSGLVGDLRVGMPDFLAAAKEIQPSATREFFTELPDVRWEDLAGYTALKQTLLDLIARPLRCAEECLRLDVSAPRGVLFTGPSGTGKTLAAKALARETGVNLIAVAGPSLFSKWFGESERALRELFQRAKQASPCILCIDELDALAGRREGRGSAAERLVSQLLMEFDALDDRLKQVVVIGTTNRPDLLDPAFLRPGRFDLVVEFPLPDLNDRRAILRRHLQGKPLGRNVSLRKLASASEGLTGAELQAVCRLAAARALARAPLAAGELDRRRPLRITRQHLEQALQEVKRGKEVRQGSAR